MGIGKSFSWLLLIGVAAIFTLILYPSMAIKKNPYKFGDVAQRDVKAHFDFLIEDMEATEENRRQAVESVLTVYDHDTAMIADISLRLRQAFSAPRAVINKEKNLRKNKKGKPEKQPAPGLSDENQTLHDKILQMKAEFEEKIGIPVSDEDFRTLEKDEFSIQTQNLIQQVPKTILSNGVVANKEILLGEKDKGITLRSVETQTEQTVMTLKSYYGPDQAKAMVRIIGQPLLESSNYALRGLVVDFCQRLVQPNITLNRNETEERKKRAVEDIKPVLYKIKKGEMLLREGERVKSLQLRKLVVMQEQMQDEQVFTTRIGTFMVILCLFLVTYIANFRDNRNIERDPNKNLLFIAIVLIIYLFLTKISVPLADTMAPLAPVPIPATSMYYAIPLASSAMTVCLFMGIRVAVPFAMVMAVCASIIFNNQFELFIYFLLSSLMAAYWIRHCRERIVFIKAGLKLGLLNLVFVTAINVYMTEYSGLKLLWDWAFAFLGGVMAGILTAGVAPLVESAFGFTTDIKLLELVNLDRPLLRRLMIEASGTYHHSVIIGSMVEAAASAIGANPLLARVCGYYHDIGKVNKPLYFIENQTGGKNKHDKLAPSMSSLILISHIKDGVEFAKKNKLGKEIIDTIRQHHGTSLISFFYDKAKQLKGEDAVNVDDYRYPGPKPQTREAGLVMLADVIEAASRTLENPTHSRIQGLVQNMINKIFSDGQLDNCELTLKDLHNIAKSFIQILDGIYHNRIEYPDSPAMAGGKGKNGNSDRQQANPADNSTGEDSIEGPSRLKRLGQS